MKYLNIKSCLTCDKKHVCRFSKNRKDLEECFKDKVMPCAPDDSPFSFRITCNEYVHDMRERSFA